MRYLALALLPLLALACGGNGRSTPAPSPAETPDGRQAGQAGEGNRVVMIIAPRDWRDEELLAPRRILEAAGVEVVVAASSLQPAKGALGATVTPDVLLADVDPEQYDAVIFVGGPGAQEYWSSAQAHQIARGAQEHGKVLGAICIAPVTLANAGVLAGRRATVWASEAPRLKAKGAEYTGRPVEVDGRIVTADGPGSAEEFGRAVLAALHTPAG